MDYQSAEDTCQDTLEGGGWVLRPASEDEIDQITMELVIRHEGEQLEYWIDRNTAENLTFNMDRQATQPGRNANKN